METIKIRVWNGFKFGYIHFMPGGTIAMPNQDYMSWYIGNDLVAFSDECAFSSYININDIEKNEIYFGDILESCKGPPHRRHGRQGPGRQPGPLHPGPPGGRPDPDRPDPRGGVRRRTLIPTSQPA